MMPPATARCRPLKIDQPRLLMVEGMDEVYFFEALLAHLNIMGIQVWDSGGKDQFPNRFRAAYNDMDKVRAYAVIRDADKDLDAAFQSVVGVLRELGEPIPDRTGTFVDRAGQSRKVGVLILPGNGARTGMLESLCLESVGNHRAMPCVQAFMNCIEAVLPKISASESAEVGGPWFPKNPAKAKSLAFLAAMHEESHRVGEAAKKKYWDFDHTCMEELKRFLRELAT
jgi:hypothetical protein